MAQNPTWNLALLGLALCFSRLVSSISPISIKGTKLYDNDGNQFFVKGIVYDKGSADPLADNNQCQIDAGLMKTLGVNTIRVYYIDNTLSHDACMQTFASQGIYIWLDLRSENPNATWTMDSYNSYTSTIDAFAKYDNLLSFSIGRDVLLDFYVGNATHAAPVVKAATRDIKAFRNARGYRPIPISYAAADVPSVRVLAADYLACGNQGDTIDMYAMDIYTWCDTSSFYGPGFDKLYEDFQHLSIPVLFSQTNCEKSDSANRNFAEVATMLGPIYQAIFSGVVVYKWSMDVGGWDGVVNYTGSSETGFPGTRDNFNALRTVYSSANPVGTAMAAYTPSNSPPSCPSSDSEWPVNPSAPLPTIPGLRVDTVTARTTIASRTGIAQGGSGAAQTDSLANGSSNPISPGAMAGIVIGCVVILGLAATGAILIIRKRHARRHDLSESGGPAAGLRSGEDGSQQGFKAELSAQAVGAVQRRHEMDALQQPKYGEISNPDACVLSPCVERRPFPSEMEGSSHPMSELSENHTETHLSPT